MSTITTFTHKITSLYVAYAADFDVAAYGGCQDEALTSLTDEIQERSGSKQVTAEEKQPR
jgi:hypothetical protein